MTKMAANQVVKIDEFDVEDEKDQESAASEMASEDPWCFLIMKWT